MTQLATLPIQLSNLYVFATLATLMTFFFVERFLVGQSTLCITVVMLQPVSTCSECMQTVFNNCQQVSTAIPQSSSEKESSTAAGSGKKAAGSAAKGKGW